MRLGSLLAVAMLIGMSSSLLPQNANAADLRDFTEADEANWKSIYAAQLTADGEWLVYLIGSASGDRGTVEAVFRRVKGAEERRFSLGDLKHEDLNLKVASSGKWAAFQFANSDVTRLDVALIDLRSGTRRDFKHVQSFDFIGQSNERILLQGYAESGSQRYMVTICDLIGSAEKTVTDVTQLSVSPSRSHVVWRSPGGLELYDVKTQETQLLESATEGIYQAFTWSRRGSALAMLRTGKTGRHLVVISHLNTPGQTTQNFDLRAHEGIEPKFTFSPRIEWRENEDGVFIEIKSIPAASELRPTVPNLAVWSWRDDELPGEKEHDGRRLQQGWFFIDLKRNRFTLLSEPGVYNVELQRIGNQVLIYETDGYGWQNTSRGREGFQTAQLRNYSLVDIHSGRHFQLLRGLKVMTRSGLSIPPQLSPDGSIFLYQDNDGDVVARDVDSTAARDLTSRLPTRFFLPENNPKTGRTVRDTGGLGGARVQGWTADGKYVLVSDYYDVWALPLRDGRPQNLTATGGSFRYSYQRVLPPKGINSDSEVDLTMPIYFEVFDRKLGKQGIARWRPTINRAEMLHMEFADLRYFRASNADTVIAMRQSAVEPPDYYRVNSQWAPSERLTDVNPQRHEFRWPPPSKYLTYRTAEGHVRNAVLHLPAGYVEGRAYPTVVEIYTDQSPSVHFFREFDPMSVSRFVHHGYAYLMPDIVPRVDNAGDAALADVTAALDAAVSTGVVDNNKVGLRGYSFGAYETSFIVTRTHRFRAALALAGVTNLWSDYGSVYADRWPKSLFSEGGQPYLSGPWWEHWDAYIRNSPLARFQDIETPLLLVHGSADYAAPFSQSLELFNSLRRLGGKPVVLLEYKGEGHVFSSKSRSDLGQRAMAYFDHFLKGAPAPDWWSAGKSIPNGQVPVERPL